MDKTKASNNKTNKAIQEASERVKSHGFFQYTIIGSFIIVIAILLGNLTNKLINSLSDTVDIFNPRIKVIIQIIITVMVIFLIKQISPYIHKEPQESYSYDILFISVYVGSQANFTEFLSYFL